MVFRNLCNIVLWMEVALSLEGFSDFANAPTKFQDSLNFHDLNEKLHKCRNVLTISTATKTMLSLS